MTAKQIEEKCALLQSRHEARLQLNVQSVKSDEERRHVDAATVSDFFAALDLLKAAETEYGDCMRAVGDSECKLVTPELVAIIPVRMSALNLVHQLSYRVYEPYDGRQPRLAAPVVALGLAPRDAKRLLEFALAQVHWEKIFQHSEQIKREREAIFALL
jgi:hypothetical protein